MPPKSKKGSRTGDVGNQVASITYAATRKNIPPAGLEAQGEVRDTEAVRYEYNPHLPPVLRWAPDAGEADALPELLEQTTRRPLSAAEAALLANALRRQQPWLEWSGKRERPWIEGADDDGRRNGTRLTFQCRQVPHVTLRSIARNTSLDPIFARHEPILAAALAALNRERATITDDLKRKLVEKLIARHRREGASAVSVDTDYDGRTFCICQAFFPDKSRWRRLAQALGGKGVVEPGAFDALSGFRSLPFPKPSGDHATPWRVAVKVIDPRGNEGLRVVSLDGTT